MEIPKGVMFNAYPDSIGERLDDTLKMLARPELEGAFSLFYILPTFFHSDLDRGFSVIDYDLNEELVNEADLQQLEKLGIGLKFDLVMNHLSVGSPQFQDMLRKGDDSYYKDFFIDWNEFWDSHGEMGPEGHMIPDDECMSVLFMRKPDLPILKVRFPDGTERPYWNTFYQEINYQPLTAEDLSAVQGLDDNAVRDQMLKLINDAIAGDNSLDGIEWGDLNGCRDQVINIAERKRRYLGQMDLNARSDKVWDFYDETLEKLRSYGGQLIRLDAFAYFDKQVCTRNFFNEPGTWQHLERLRGIADKHQLTLLPEIHTQYGYKLHEQVASHGYPIYDFFLPGLLIDALDRGINTHLAGWIAEVRDKGIQTVNMLGCHDGIPVLDLRGHDGTGVAHGGLLSDAEIDAVIDRIMERGGRVKNLYGPDGKKIAYYQVNATYFSALGEDERKLLLARAIQLFTPGIPQIWYLDLFAGKNDYVAADNGGTGGHKEINRTTLSLEDVERGLQRGIVQDQLQLIRLRNSSPAFYGELEIGDSDEQHLQLTWKNGACTATLDADLAGTGFTVSHANGDGAETVLSFN